MTSCRGTTVSGEPCNAPATLVAHGWCPTHRPGAEDAMREARSKGGRATAAKHHAKPFSADEIVKLVTLEDAKLALDQIRTAVLLRRITHSEGASATKAVDSWVRTEAAVLTSALVGDLRRELAAKTGEIDAVRTELAQVRLRVLQ